MNERETLLNKVRAFAFAEKEWNLYLDTHPTDKEGLYLHKKMADKTKELTKEFESKFGPLTTLSVDNPDCFEWIDGPWPWE